MITDTLEKFIQGKGIRVGFMEGEDARVLEAVYYLKEMPICEEVYQILYEGKEPKTCANDLMLRELKQEF